MLKARVIPTILLSGPSIVKDRQFRGERRVGTLLPAVRVYNARDVDELMILDIRASRFGRGPDLDQITGVASEISVPLSVGGGVGSLHDFEQVLKAGADKVVINSAAYSNPALISDAADRFGSQCIIASIDVARDSSGLLRCISMSGTTQTAFCLEDHIARVQDDGAGELLINSIPNDGELCGYDEDLVKTAARNATIPVIASGGCASYEDMFNALTKCGASAVAAASMFHFTEQTPKGAREYLAGRGVRVRDSEIS